MYPGRSSFRHHETEPRTDVAIRRTPAEDLYLVMAMVDLSQQRMSLQVVVNPLVDWIWMGFGVLAFGTGIALLPESTFTFALSKLPAEAAVTTTVALLVALLGTTTLSAQMSGGSDTQISFFPRTEFEKRMQHEIVCTCGCGHTTIAECRKDPCDTSSQLRGELARYIDRGLTHDQILQAFIANHGDEEMIGAPLNKGFRRLSWLFPYLLGATGIVLVGFAAAKWTRPPMPKADSPAMDAEFDERLDDELRNLD
jgi:cytochrome c-type biogenesis protein CcmF